MDDAAIGDFLKQAQSDDDQQRLERQAALEVTNRRTRTMPSTWLRAPASSWTESGSARCRSPLHGWSISEIGKQS